MKNKSNPQLRSYMEIGRLLQCKFSPRCRNHEERKSPYAIWFHLLVQTSTLVCDVLFQHYLLQTTRLSLPLMRISHRLYRRKELNPWNGWEKTENEEKNTLLIQNRGGLRDTDKETWKMSTLAKQDSIPAKLCTVESNAMLVAGQEVPMPQDGLSSLQHNMTEKFGDACFFAQLTNWYWKWGWIDPTWMQHLSWIRAIYEFPSCSSLEGSSREESRCRFFCF